MFGTHGLWFLPLIVWDTKSGDEILCLRGSSIMWVTHVAYSHDGQKIVSCAHTSNMIEIWDAESGSLLGSWESSGPDIQAIVFSAVGQLITSTKSGDGKVQIWDVNDGTCI